jgi:vacuolar-type H+-ATPase subunit C/Vma6
MKPSRGSRAYAHARMRACKSRLLTRADAALLIAATDAASMQRVIAALGIDDPLQRLLRVYQTAIDGYRDGAPLFRAMLQLHEIENVKLLWRVAANGHRDRIARLWIDLRAFASLPMLVAATMNELPTQLAGTPYAEIAKSVARAHGNDVAAAELAFDRWVSRRLLDEARRLPHRESIARRLIELVVGERDAQLGLRGAKWYGLTSVAPDKNADVTSLRRERLRLCRRAFVGSPFLLGPAVAVILLAEEEVRAVRALVERMGDEHLDTAMIRTISGSQVGA